MQYPKNEGTGVYGHTPYLPVILGITVSTCLSTFALATPALALDPYQETGGQVVMEAENFDSLIHRNLSLDSISYRRTMNSAFVP